MSQPIRSARFFVFASCIVVFWFLVPPFILSRFIGPLGPGLIFYLIFLYFALPKINSWLCRNTPFGKLWTWARINEVKLEAEAKAAKAEAATVRDIPHESTL